MRICGTCQPRPACRCRISQQTYSAWKTRRNLTQIYAIIRTRMIKGDDSLLCYVFLSDAMFYGGHIVKRLSIHSISSLQFRYQILNCGVLYMYSQETFYCNSYHIQNSYDRYMYMYLHCFILVRDDVKMKHSRKRRFAFVMLLWVFIHLSETCENNRNQTV